MNILIKIVMCLIVLIHAGCQIVLQLEEGGQIEVDKEVVCSETTCPPYDVPENSTFNTTFVAEADFGYDFVGWEGFYQCEIEEDETPKEDCNINIARELVLLSEEHQDLDASIKLTAKFRLKENLELTYTVQNWSDWSEYCDWEENKIKIDGIEQTSLTSGIDVEEGSIIFDLSPVMGKFGCGCEPLRGCDDALNIELKFDGLICNRTYPEGIDVDNQWTITIPPKNCNDMGQLD